MEPEEPEWRQNRLLQAVIVGLIVLLSYLELDKDYDEIFFLPIISGLVAAFILLYFWEFIAFRFSWLLPDYSRTDKASRIAFAGFPLFVAVIIAIDVREVLGCMIYYEYCSYDYLILGEFILSDDFALSFVLPTVVGLGLLAIYYHRNEFDFKKYLLLLFAIIYPFSILLSAIVYDDRNLQDTPQSVFYFITSICAYLTFCVAIQRNHSGFNGLAAGNAFVIFIALYFGLSVAYNVRGLGIWNNSNILIVATSINVPPDRGWYGLVLAGLVLGFLWSNLPPAWIVDDSSTHHLWGVAIGFVLILENLEMVGLILFAPHIIDAGLRIHGWQNGVSQTDAFVVENGEIRVEHTSQLKLLVASYFPREWHALLVLWAIQACAAFLFVSAVPLAA